MRRLWLTCGSILTLMALTASVQAGPITIMDVYIGAKSAEGDDAIGGFYFDISKMVVTLSNNLVVDIYTHYVNNIGDHLTGLGDLFISTNGWRPFGSSPYTGDDWLHGEQPEYVLKFNNYPELGTKSGDLGLYAVDPNGVQTSFMTPPYELTSYREGQEVRYIPVGGQNPLLSGSWSIFDGTDPYLRFSVPLDSGPLQGVTDFGFHWAMTCGNDVIEGEVSTVPEPASIILIAAGLLSIAYIARKKIFTRAIL
jgi:hypothetical protein